MVMTSQDTQKSKQTNHQALAVIFLGAAAALCLLGKGGADTVIARNNFYNAPREEQIKAFYHEDTKLAKLVKVVCKNPVTKLDYELDRSDLPDPRKVANKLSNGCRFRPTVY